MGKVWERCGERWCEEWDGNGMRKGWELLGKMSGEYGSCFGITV